MLKEHWSKYVQGCCQKWNEDFEFLKWLPTYHSYLALLGMATSVNHLEKLYQMLPDHVRLLRDDWLKLKNFWKRYFVGKIADTYRDQLVEWLLSEQYVRWMPSGHNLSSTSTATGYYVDRIRKHAAKEPPVHFARGGDGIYVFNPEHAVLSCPERRDHGCKHFQTKIFGTIVETTFLLSENGDNMLVRFVFKEAELTEEITYQLMSQLPSYYIFKLGVTGGSSIEGVYLNIAFEFETGELADTLTPLDEDFVASGDFLSAAANVLREQGIPVEGDLAPIMVETSDADAEEA